MALIRILKCERYISIPLQNAIFHFEVLFAQWGFQRGDAQLLPFGASANLLRAQHVIRIYRSHSMALIRILKCVAFEILLA